MRPEDLPAARLVAESHKVPLCDHETFVPGTEYLYFFQNSRTEASGRVKQGSSYFWLPDSYQFYWYSILVLVDGGSDARQAEHFWNEGRVEFRMTQNITHEWPVRLLMPPPRPIPTAEIPRTRLLLALGGGKDVTVSGRPVHIRDREQWEVRVMCRGLTTELGVMVCMFGIRLRAIGA